MSSHLVYDLAPMENRPCPGTLYLSSSFYKSRLSLASVCSIAKKISLASPVFPQSKISYHASICINLFCILFQCNRISPVKWWAQLYTLLQLWFNKCSSIIVVHLPTMSMLMKVNILFPAIYLQQSFTKVIWNNFISSSEKVNGLSSLHHRGNGHRGNLRLDLVERIVFTI